MAYALEGSIATAGSGVSFLVDNMGLAPDAASISALADSVSDSGGVVFVTAFSGLFAPYWIDDARGEFQMFGLQARSGIYRCIDDSTDSSRYDVWHNNEDSTGPHCPCCFRSGKSTGFDRTCLTSLEAPLT